MLYHRGSYNYRVGIRVLRRAGAKLLKSEGGIRVVHRLTGEPVESLREHAGLLAARGIRRMSFSVKHGRGWESPGARLLSPRSARAVQNFREVNCGHTS